MKGFAQALSVSTAVLLNAGNTAAATPIADFGMDMLGSGNPNGNWSYAQAPVPGGLLTLMDSFKTAGPGPGLGVWYPLGSSGPEVGANLLGTVFSIVTASYLPHEGYMHPGADGRYAVARLTVPNTITGMFSVMFEGADFVGGTSVDVHVWRNGVSQFSDGIIGYGDSANYSVSGTFTAGETLDLYVGTGGNGWSYDSTGVFATLTDTLTEIPEPNSLVLLGLGLAIVMAGRQAVQGPNEVGMKRGIR